MVVYRSRGENVGQTETVRLRAQFRDHSGSLVDLDSIPEITIEEPSGNVALGPTSVGVYRLSVGTYGYDYAIAYNASLGVYVDHWVGSLSGFSVQGSFNFVVQNTQLPAINTDGYIHLGDDPGFNYSQVAIANINDLLKTLRARLDSRGRSKSEDQYGNVTYTDCDIFTVDQLVSFLVYSLGMFNEIGFITLFTFDDTEMMQQFHSIIVQGASLMAMGTKSLLERGREFSITDNSLAFNPPTVSELLNSIFGAELTLHFDRVKAIKTHLRPSPFGLGTMSISTVRSPAIARLRHLRARQVY
jgi:hypothetical protein